MLRRKFQQEFLEVGVDEAGRGCLAGPVVAAAVVLPDDFILPKLNDSKQLAYGQRLQLSDMICKQAIAYGVAEASVEEIDQYNILQATFLAMHRALEQVFIQLPSANCLILVDGNRFKPYPFVSHRCVVRGDATYACIAAASVLAKVYRDQLMQQLDTQYPQYGWATNAGYPTQAHRRAIAQYGTCCWHRKSFRGCGAKNRIDLRKV